ncbi:hypothetical protein GCM10009114_10950 [Aliiglaciecola litoralis]|uniref:Class GN sortase n=1 Tax=Aliiglaciecola litoralis TaxID=582857 RepID=A0ABN1LF06_9ALTE
MFVASGYIHAKATLAQYLIASAWRESIQTDQPISPWSWADTHPVAKLSIAGESYYVLAGASGRVLAFGPGHMSATPLPGESGNVVISGHRDTHFAVLEQVRVGDVIDVETTHQQMQYQVLETRIAHQSQMELTASGNEDLLTLITCYPFNGVDPNPELRFVVRAQLIKPNTG